MMGQLDNLSEQDLADMAAFYAAQPVNRGGANPELAELGENIYRHGIPHKGIAACTACHSPPAWVTVRQNSRHWQASGLITLCSS